MHSSRGSLVDESKGLFLRSAKIGQIKTFWFTESFSKTFWFEVEKQCSTLKRRAFRSWGRWWRRWSRWCHRCRWTLRKCCWSKDLLVVTRDEEVDGGGWGGYGFHGPWKSRLIKLSEKCMSGSDYTFWSLHILLHLQWLHFQKSNGRTNRGIKLYLEQSCWISDWQLMLSRVKIGVIYTTKSPYIFYYLAKIIKSVLIQFSFRRNVIQITGFVCNKNIQSVSKNIIS